MKTHGLCTTPFIIQGKKVPDGFIGDVYNYL